MLEKCLYFALQNISALVSRMERVMYVHILPSFYSSLGPVGFGGKEWPEWLFLKAFLPCRALELITAKCSTTFFVEGFKLATV